MRDSKSFLYALLTLDFTAAMMAWGGLLLIEEQTIDDVGGYISFYWNIIYEFLIGYPLQVFILISVTAAVSYLLELFGFRIR